MVNGLEVKSVLISLALVLFCVWVGALFIDVFDHPAMPAPVAVAVGPVPRLVTAPAVEFGLPVRREVARLVSSSGDFFERFDRVEFRTWDDRWLTYQCSGGGKLELVP